MFSITATRTETREYYEKKNTQKMLLLYVKIVLPTRQDETTHWITLSLSTRK